MSSQLVEDETMRQKVTVSVSQRDTPVKVVSAKLKDPLNLTLQEAGSKLLWNLDLDDCAIERLTRLELIKQPHLRCLPGSNQWKRNQPLTPTPALPRLPPSREAPWDSSLTTQDAVLS